jgi:hypothetical protein
MLAFNTLHRGGRVRLGVGLPLVMNGNVLLQRLARFVRKTLSFSKSDDYHEAALSLFIHRYNQTLKQSISQF